MASDRCGLSAAYLSAIRGYTLTHDDLITLNPSSRTAVLYRTSIDAKISIGMHTFVRSLRGTQKSAKAESDYVFASMLNATSGSKHFIPSCKNNSKEPSLVPLYEAKYFHQFDHRWASFNERIRGADITTLSDEQKVSQNETINTKYKVRRNIVQEAFGKHNWAHAWIVAVRDICRPGDQRTCIAAVLPICGLTNSANVAYVRGGALSAALFVAEKNSLVFDFLVRGKQAGTHLNKYIFEQIPAIPLECYTVFDKKHISEIVCELTCTTDSLSIFAEEVGCSQKIYRNHSLLTQERIGFKNQESSQGPL